MVAPFESWLNMEQYEKEGFRELFLQRVLGQTCPVFSEFDGNKRSIIHILHSGTKYVGEFGVEDHHTWEVVEFVIHPTERREPRPVLI